MPQPFWKHLCSVGGPRESRGSPWACETCGAAAEFDGWRYGMLGAMFREQSRYGFKLFGPHRRRVEEAFANSDVPCVACRGKGLLPARDGDGYRHCDGCGGFGRVFLLSDPEIEAIRQEIIEEFPDSAAPRLPHMFSRPEAITGGEWRKDFKPPAQIAVREAVADDDDEEDDEIDIESLCDPDSPDYPWAGVTSEHLGEVLGRNARLDFELPGGIGRVLTGAGSIQWALMSLVPKNRVRAVEEAFEEAGYGMPELSEIFDSFIPSVRCVVSCSVTDSMVGGSWSLNEFQLGNRGYIYNQPDWGIGHPDECLPILGAWEPAESAEARRACIERVYEQNWKACVLPPRMGQWAGGDTEILQTCVRKALASSPGYWYEVVKRLTNCKSFGTPPPTASGIADVLGVPADAVVRILDRLADPAPAATETLHAEADDRDREILLWLFIRCIAQAP